MPNITINIPPAAVPTIVGALRNRYRDSEEPLPAGEGSALSQGVARLVREALVSDVRAHRAQQAQEAAAAAAASPAEQDAAVESIGLA